MFVVISKRLWESVRPKINSGYLDSHIRYLTQSLVNCDSRSRVENNEKSFTVSYLVESCGLSMVNAILVAKKVQFETPERADSVLTLLKNQGFPSTHIAIVVKRRPSLLLVKEPEKSLLPKFEFLRSIGLSGYEITRIVTKDPSLLSRSLVNQITPFYNFLKSVLETDERIHKSFRRSNRIFWKKVHKTIKPNLTLLRELEVPQSSLVYLVSQFPDTAFMPHNKFILTIEELKRMGFDPRKSMFVHGIQAFFAIGRENIGKKFKTYMQWGLSMDEVLMAFRRQPLCMALSDQNIQMTMDLLINRMGWSPDLVAKNPVVLCLSLEKRVKPRCSVFQVLVSRNLVKKNTSIGTLMTPAEENFMKRFVTKFSEAVPQLIDVYQGKIDPSTLIIESSTTET